MERTYFLVHGDGGAEEDEEGGSQKGEAQEQDDGVEDFLGPGELKCTQENGHQYFRGIPSLQTVI